MQFSVLISVYLKERPEYLERCFASLKEQTLPATEVVLIEDGPLTQELYRALDDWQDILPLRRIPLKENVGLGAALARGVKECSHEIIARMDTDDVCVPDRFEKQMQYLSDNPDIDILGSAIGEFETDPALVRSTRTLPLHNSEIRKYARHRNPFNHMTVVYRKQSVLDAGNYLQCNYFEDYYLWIRMLSNGCLGTNREESLVLACAGKDMLKRRHGWKYAAQEAKFWGLVRNTGFISAFEYWRNILMRCSTRLAPYCVLKFIYYRLLRKDVS